MHASMHARENDTERECERARSAPRDNINGIITN